MFDVKPIQAFLSLHSDSLQQPEPLKTFCTFLKNQQIPDEAQAKYLLQLFGSIQQSSVTSLLENSPLKSIYERQSHGGIKDLTLILKHNLENLKSILNQKKMRFSPLPNPHTENYSWANDKLYSTNSTVEELALKTFENFLFTHPMPVEVAKAMGLYTLKNVSNAYGKLSERQKAIEALAPTLFKLGREDITKSDFLKEKNIILFQRLLFTLSAVVEDGKFSSWIKEIMEWGRENPHTYNDFIKFVKFLDLFKGKTINLESIEEDSSQNKEPKLNPSYSFGEYIRNKTLNQITNIIDLEKVIKDALLRIFYNSETSRQLVCFYLCILHELFPGSHSSQQTQLTELIDLTATRRKEDVVKQALNILNRITPGASPLIKNILAALTITVALSKEFCVSDKKERSHLFGCILHFNLKYEEAYQLLEFINIISKKWSIRQSLLASFNDDARKNQIFECFGVIYQVYCKFLNKLDPFHEISRIVKAYLSHHNDGDFYLLFLLIAFYLHDKNASFDYFFSENKSEEKGYISTSVKEYFASLKKPSANIKKINDICKIIESKVIQKGSKDPYFTIKRYIDHFKLNPQEEEFFLQILDYIHCLFYLKLSEKNKELLFNQLDKITPKDRELYHREILLYSETIKEINSQNTFQKRLHYFASIYQNCLETLFPTSTTKKPYFPDIEEVIKEWPNSFYKFDVNTKLIELLQKLLHAKLPMQLFMNILLYPIVLSPMLDLIKQAIILQNKVNHLSRQLFIPPSISHSLNEIIRKIQESDCLIPSHLLPSEQQTSSAQQYLKMVNLVRSAVLLNPTYMNPILTNASILFDESSSNRNSNLQDESSSTSNPPLQVGSSINNNPAIQNDIFPLDEKNSQGPLCLAKWTKDYSKQTLEFTLIKSAQSFETCQDTFFLEIPLKDLQPELQPLFQVMCQEICKEPTHLADEERINNSALLNENEELELCLSLFPKCKKAYDSFIKDNESKQSVPTDNAVINYESKQSALSILRFVKQIKTFVRSTLADFQRENIKFLIPLRQTEINDLSGLCEILKTSNVPLSSLCQLQIQEKMYDVKVNFNRHKKGETEKSDLEGNQSKERTYNEITFTIKDSDPLCSYSLLFPEIYYIHEKNMAHSRLIGFNSDEEIENALRWALESLKKKFISNAKTQKH